MNRLDIVFPNISKDAIGLEIGPCYNPCAPKSQGYNCESLDYLDRDGLISAYKNNPSAILNNIEDVDYVWKGERFPELTGKTGHYDYIISCHSIEHTTDIIAFLQDCSAIMKETGSLVLVIPDKRFCFDRFRPPTCIGKVIDDYLNHSILHSAGMVVEDTLNTITLNDRSSFSNETKGEYKFYLFSVDTALENVKSITEEKKFVNIHNYVFTPASFRLLMEDLNMLGFIDLVITKFEQRDSSYEFFAVLSKSKTKIEVNLKHRMELFKAIEKELSKQYTD